MTDSLSLQYQSQCLDGQLFWSLPSTWVLYSQVIMVSSLVQPCIKWKNINLTISLFIATLPPTTLQIYHLPPIHQPTKLPSKYITRLQSSSPSHPTNISLVLPLSFIKQPHASCTGCHDYTCVCADMSSIILVIRGFCTSI